MTVDEYQKMLDYLKSIGCADVYIDSIDHCYRFVCPEGYKHSLYLDKIMSKYNIYANSQKGEYCINPDWHRFLGD
jgi:hypothetical protein